MRLFKKVASSVIVVIITIIMICISAFAYTEDELIEYIASEGINSILINKMLTSNYEEISSDSEALYFSIYDNNGNVYYVKEGYTKKELLEKAESVMRSKDVSNDLYGMTGGLSVEAKTKEAANTLKDFIPAINIALGILTVLITLGMAVITSLDVCYIVFPAFRETLGKYNEQREMYSAHNKFKGIRFVSDEAQYVVDKCSVMQNGNPLTEYLKKRIVAYIMVSVILFILLTGNMTVITNIAIKIISYIMAVIASL